MCAGITEINFSNIYRERQLKLTLKPILGNVAQHWGIAMVAPSMELDALSRNASGRTILSGSVNVTTNSFWTQTANLVSYVVQIVKNPMSLMVAIASA